MNPRNSLNLLMQNFETANRGHWAGRRALQGIASCVAVMSALVLAPSAYAEGDLVVQDLILSRGIYEREPADIAKSFEPSDERAYAFARISNEGPLTSVSFVWHYGSNIHAKVDLNVGTSQGWRTWSSAKLKSGDWRVELVTEEGEVLAERAFTVAPLMGNATAPVDEARSSDESASQSQKAPITSEYPRADFDG